MKVYKKALDSIWRLLGPSLLAEVSHDEDSWWETSASRELRSRSDMVEYGENLSESVRRSAEIVRFKTYLETSWNILTVETNLHFWLLMVKFWAVWRLTVNPIETLLSAPRGHDKDGYWERIGCSTERPSRSMFSCCNPILKRYLWGFFLLAVKIVI